MYLSMWVLGCVNKDLIIIKSPHTLCRAEPTGPACVAVLGPLLGHLGRLERAM